MATVSAFAGSGAETHPAKAVCMLNAPNVTSTGKPVWVYVEPALRTAILRRTSGTRPTNRNVSALDFRVIETTLSWVQPQVFTLGNV
jgi:hypothetical protein